MRLARVFPRRTRATPTDKLAFVGEPPTRKLHVDAVHVSVTFSWDIEEGKRLHRLWADVAPTAIGGPALGTVGGEFVSGRYLKPGYTITSRGCPNHCWFCRAWKRDGTTRELSIVDGWDVLDDNLLACSPAHIDAVFEMLARQHIRPKFTGGLEAARLTPEISSSLRRLHPEAIFFAYDTPDDLPHLLRAAEMVKNAGIPTAGHRVRAYVLCGYPKDTIRGARKRMLVVAKTGIFPMGMLWRDDKNTKPKLRWRRFVRQWTRPAIINANLRTAKLMKVPHE
jgi:hypothetical protein